MLGETAFDTGFYDLIVTIAVIGIFMAVVEYWLSFWGRRTTPTKHRWSLPTINVLAGLGLLAICATPWAHFNVGHPLADRIYEVRSVIKPDMHYVSPGNIREYSYDPNVWSCTSGPCQSERDDTRSLYTHRTLGISFRHVAYYDCLTPEFNIAIKDAIGESIDGFDGDVRRFERAFFDQDGRFVGPNARWFDKPLMRSHLSDAEKQPSPVSFDDLITQLANWDHEDYHRDHLPMWSDWTSIRTAILSGETRRIHHTPGLLVGLRMKNGRELIGTQPQPGAIERALAECGAKCENTSIVDW